MKVQTSPGNHSNVKVFGDNNYAKALEFHEKKSPVKMRLTYNDTYNNYQLSDRDVIQACNRMEVDFQYDTNIGESSTTSILSKSMKIKELKTMSPDNTYYSVKGTVILGKEPPVVLSFGPLKGDVVIVDSSAYIRVKVYGLQVINSLKHEQSYSFSHLKIRKSGGEVLLTTTPQSIITMIANMGIPLPDQNVFSTQVTLLIPRLKQLGDIDRFFSCENKKCKKKLADVTASTKGPVKCNHCSCWMPREDLVETVMTKLFLEEKGHLIEVTAPKTSLATVVGDWTDDNTIAAALFNLRNVKLTYSVVSKLLLHLSTDEGQAKEGEEMRSREEESEKIYREEEEKVIRKVEHERDKQQRNNEEDV